MRDNTKRFFASHSTLIPLETSDDLTYGYSFVWDKSINGYVVDCLLNVCSDIDLKFGNQRDKESFIDALVMEAVESFALWSNMYSDFDISTSEGREEFFSHVMGEARIIGKEYGYDEDEQEIMKDRDSQWATEDYCTEKDFNLLKEFTREA